VNTCGDTYIDIDIDIDIDLDIKLDIDLDIYISIDKDTDGDTNTEIKANTDIQTHRQIDIEKNMAITYFPPVTATRVYISFSYQTEPGDR